MNYITDRRSSVPSNEPYEISYKDIRQMYLQNLSDEAECRKVTESSRRGESYYMGDGRPGEGKESNFQAAFFKEILYRDPKTAGFMMEYPHGTVIRQAERSHYYRGENQIYEKSLASVYRGMARFQSEEERQIYKLVADMRVGEFGTFLFRLGITQFWVQNYGTVLFEPLAQHYGLETEWLDMTNDFNVALFFAACHWDAKEKRWLPLKKAQTEQSEKTKYGVLFHIPQWRAAERSMTMALDDSGFSPNVILPIGYQPFMRCHSQTGYGIHMTGALCSLQEDSAFEKLYFRHNEKLSADIYNLMDQGRKVYPQEGLNDFEDVITAIRQSVEFSDEAFQYAFGKSAYFTDIEACERTLAESKLFGQPIRIMGDVHPYSVSRQRIRRLNRQYEGFSLEKKYGIRLMMRKVYYPSNSVEDSQA